MAIKGKKWIISIVHYYEEGDKERMERDEMKS